MIVESAETVTQERPGPARPGFHDHLPEMSQSERYVQRKLIGGGSFADVYSAWDTRLQIQVALKVLRPELFASEQRLNDFMQGNDFAGTKPAFLEHLLNKLQEHIAKK